MDEQLARRARTGDVEALEALWGRQKRWVSGVLLAHMPREADLDDLLQDVALKLVEKVRTLENPAAWRPWLRAIAVHLAVSDGRRTTHRRGAVPFADPEEQATAAGAHVRATGRERVRDRVRRVLDLVGDLPVQYREPLVLKAIEGMSLREIAEVMDVTVATVETRLARARRSLREAMTHQDRRSDQPTPLAVPPGRHGAER